MAAIQSFEKMNLKHELLQGIFAYGFEKPSQIQAQAIIPVSTGRDCVVQAQSGTGKTGTFCVGVLQRLDMSIKTPQALMIAPTRELARQTETVLASLGSFMGVTTQLLVGGTSVADDKAALHKGCHVVVGTPGRVAALIEQKSFQLDALKALIVDEADEMLSQGFLKAMQLLISQVPPRTQIALFSATLPPEIISLTEKFMEDPVRILVKAEQVTLEGIRQFSVNVDQNEKFTVICDLFDSLSLQQTVVYCNKKETVIGLSNAMLQENHIVASIHGDLSPEERTKTMDDFRKGKARVLISTDLTARGIDVQNLSLVINYDIPRDVHFYIHRVGRSGRFGRKGTAINLVDPKYEARNMEAIEKFYHTVSNPLPRDLSKLLD